MSDLDAMRFEDEFEPTFTGTLNEKAWIVDALGGFYADRLISDVLYRVKGGKEATVYCCRADGSTGMEYIAAKVFRPRMFRAMKNDSLYKQGRGLQDAEGKTVLDSRSLRAIRRKTRHGQALDTASWCQHEYAALSELHRLGADVPRPIAATSHAILMEYIGDVSFAAPTLQSVSLDVDEAESVLARLIHNVEVMLSTYRIHADLSAYNVLYWQGRVVVIDFPQAVDAQRHPEAYALLARDVDRLCQYFRKQGVRCEGGAIADDIWRRFVHGGA